MGIHGRASFLNALEASCALDKNVDAAGDAARNQPIPGFKHFITTPCITRRFAIDGVPFDPSKEPQQLRAATLMRKLANAVAAEAPPRDFNHSLPSGYVYFLQLLAHDLVQSSLFLSRGQGQVHGLANARQMPLRLETIYGGGPIQCPFAFEGDKDGFRNRLRLGKTRKDNLPYGDNSGKIRDLARARPTSMLAEPEYSEALIVDARNDSHAILSQMVVVFHYLHNVILKSLEANEKLAGKSFAAAQKRFAATQSACILIYRSIIQNDLLPKILHPAVSKAYKSIQLLDPPKDLESNMWLAPLEFTFGFFRFGHAMIRGVYSFNDKRSTDKHKGFDITSVLERTSERRPRSVPLENTWTIDWRYFFGADVPGANHSVPIGPWSRSDLENSARGDDGGGLTFRDLMSSISTTPWSVRALTEEISKSKDHADLIKLSPYLAGHADGNKPPWFDGIQTWLRDRSRPGVTPSAEDIDILAADPPIPFFARFEAGMDPAINGKHLGVLTSIVVADVFRGIFQHDNVLGIPSGLDLGTELQRLSEIAFDKFDGAFPTLGQLTSFNDLVAFLSEKGDYPPGG